MATNLLVSPEVMRARIRIYFEETLFASVPLSVDDKSLDELAYELADVFESPFATHEDFLDPADKDWERLHATIAEVDEFVERRLSNAEVAYA